MKIFTGILSCVLILNIISLFNMGNYVFAREETKTLQLSKNETECLDYVKRKAQEFEKNIDDLIVQKERSQQERLTANQLISKVNTYLIQLSNSLGGCSNSNDKSNSTATLASLLDQVKTNLHVVANEQFITGTPLDAQKEQFAKLLEAGLLVQLGLVYHIPRWAEKFDETGKKKVKDTVQVVQKTINTFLYILAEQYKDLAEQENNIVKQEDSLKEKTSPPYYLSRAQLMLARVIIYPPSSFVREPYRVEQASKAAELQGRIAVIQDDTEERNFFAQLNIGIGKKYAEILKIIFTEN